MSSVETTTLGQLTVPRVINGLWQLSSPAWGAAPVSKIRREMKRYVEAGYTAFDMADHYGSAEQIFGSFRNSLPKDVQANVICATKWCVFQPTDPTPQFVRAAVEERLKRTGAHTVDLLQLHWSDYSNRAYVTALQHLHALQHPSNRLINALGLCNFDSARTDEICTALGPGVIVSNQIQFSLIDTRPLYGMAAVCVRHNVKLLTYGTLCGGFLADKYLGSPQPDAYDECMTPSQRKYLDVILSAWGDWSLFQRLLGALRTIGDRHGARSIAVIATRWVLDHAFVAAAIIGTRLGVSEHTSDNQRVFGFRLTPEDNAAIQRVLVLSNSRGLVAKMGDCGTEYR
ncbi:Aldo/keto reductase [Gautieria morchelliformis]|nr:Aldo/keto reductase [Gautieria morchelliformis]